MKTIGIEEALELENAYFIDVRSPKEYEEDHIDGAINIPLLDNDERAIIGSLYKQEGKESALTEGYKFVNPKLENLERQLRALGEERNLILYCFRGGMRSGSVTEFAENLGLNVYKLEGGYKSYRNYVLDYLKNIEGKFQFVVLHGNTCVGKTDLLKGLEARSLNILDLEDMAKNSGSVFGDIYHEDEKSNQKNFESQIFTKLRAYEKTKDPMVFMESESKKIGRCMLSKEFWDMMQKARHLLVEASLASRVERSVHDYSLKSNNCDKKLISSVHRLKDSLGNEAVRILENRINGKDYAYVAGYLMENYYDQLYRHSESKYSYELSVDSSNIDKALDDIMNWYEDNKKLK